MDQHSLIFNYYSLKENNCTKALLNILEHSEQGLRLEFITKFLSITPENMECRFYYQFNDEIEHTEGNNYIIAIAERINWETLYKMNCMRSIV